MQPNAENYLRLFMQLHQIEPKCTDKTQEDSEVCSGFFGGETEALTEITEPETK